MKNTLHIMIVMVWMSLILSCNQSSKPISEKVEVVLETKETVLTTKQETVPIIKPVDYIDSMWSEINFEESGYVEKMVYAQSSNFTKQQIYPCARCFLRPEVAQALDNAKKSAQQLGLKLLIFDCYRPTKYQQVMFDIIQNPQYVAAPKKGGSMHNKGLAVDIALTDSTGKILDFGGEFDDFSSNAHHNNSKLDSIALTNRNLLKKIMIEAGFSSYQYEWWHYNYRQVKYKLDDFIWNCN